MCFIFNYKFYTYKDNEKAVFLLHLQKQKK